MRRGRQKKSNKGSPAAEVFRKSTTPVVVICPSDWLPHTERFCDKAPSKWPVMVHNPDTGKWWDRLGKTSRIRHGPPEKCHLVVAVAANSENDNNNNDQENQRKIQQATTRLGERTEIATIAILYLTKTNGEVPLQRELENAMPPDCIRTILQKELLDSFTEIRSLWAFQDEHDSTTKEPLLFDQVPQICQYWSALMWRFNGFRIQDLYQRLRQVGQQEEGKEEFKEDSKDNGTSDAFTSNLIQKHRRDLEQKAKELLEDPDTERVADLVLTGGVTKDENLFGRIHTWALSAAAQLGNARYLMVIPNKKQPITLNAYDYTTVTNHCTNCIQQLKFVAGTERPHDQFCIPAVGSAIMTVSMIPSLFPSGIVGADHFDTVLGSRRIWSEHLALKASILYSFHGQPGSLWDMSMEVVRGALPRTWGILLNEPPDEDFLRALLHPDVVDAGRLVLRATATDTNDSVRAVPSHFDVMSRIFALGRFLETLDDPDILVTDMATRRAVASTMKIRQERVEAVVIACKQGRLSLEACENIMKDTAKPKSSSSEGPGMTSKVTEVLGMLAVFLHRDRKSVRDANRFDPYSFDDQAYTTSKALADCAMYCGKMKWLAEEDDEEDGIWTCQPCLHRWQRRAGPRHALQTRKLMHPMKMTPFTREEYYDGPEWDNIMQATGGNISLLGVDFYWGRCSTEGCGRVCQGVARSGACAETDGVPIGDFPETVDVHEDQIQLRRSLEALGPLGPNNTVTSGNLEKYFDSEEKLTYLPPPIRRRVRNCIDKSTYILPPGLLCDNCGAVPDGAIDEYCPYCGTGFEPVFACVHYSCPHCNKHFCKACLGIEGIHFRGVYNARSHVCWRVLGNRYSYHNRGFCARCSKERPWPESHKLISAGPEIRRKALDAGAEGMPLAEAIKMQSANLRAFTDRYAEGERIFLSGTHTSGLGPNYCSCGEGVNADEHGDGV
ncbi:expressed unknown protein [Seminavis robusta]|uniref:Uncharacterized protein n=1 Tax=Seminavis robusta TaxID=568900 RepID=A0A9N8HHB5_9STRA|nr:expressed unknown protein [Seminavis robusta]|eukprot:Sro553_g165360.1 n/a (954) ;mRNA; r:37703-40564